VDDDGYFDERIAAAYDDSIGEEFDPGFIDAVVDLLADLADGGRTLEFAIGTGRIAVPLSRRGLRVSGIDMSRAMVARLRDKPGADAIDVTIGDMSTTRVDGSFSLVYLVFNTIENVTTQLGQVDCFRNAAAHLEPGGCFLIEVGVPDLQRLPPGERFRPFRVSQTGWGFDEYDVVNQGLISHHFDVVGDRLDRVSMPFRYAYPAEFDLMAHIAGLRLRDRWSGWQREPFDELSRKNISVWEKPAD